MIFRFKEFTVVLFCLSFYMLLSGCSKEEELGKAGMENNVVEEGPVKEISESVPDEVEALSNTSAVIPFEAVEGPAVFIQSVADSSNDGHLPEWTLDESLDDESRWSAAGVQSWIQYGLSSAVDIDTINIAFFRGHMRKTSFEVHTSIDNINWSFAYKGESSGMTSDYEAFTFPSRSASFVKITGYGNSVNTWNSILDISIPHVQIGDFSYAAEFNELSSSVDSVTQLPEEEVVENPVVFIQNVEDSNNDGHIPEWTLDSSLDDESRWSAAGVQSWIKYGLSSDTDVSAVDIAFFRGDMRKTSFEIHTSIDNINWSLAYKGESSGTTNDYESFTFTSRRTNFVKIIGFGNSVNTWNSILGVSIPNVQIGDFSYAVEFDALNPNSDSVTQVQEEDPVVFIESVENSNNDGHIPEWTLDASLDDESRWSATSEAGVQPWIQYGLSSAADIDTVNIAFFRGDVRKTNFEIHTSTDNTGWSLAYKGESSGVTSDYETFVFTSRSARFVRITGYGNNISAWSSILDISIPNVQIGDFSYAAEFNALNPSDDSVVQNPEDEVVEEQEEQNAEEDVPQNVLTSADVVAVSASNSDGHEPELTLDGLFSDGSRWSAQPIEGVNPWVEYQLEGDIEIASIDIAFFRGNVRMTSFDLMISSDGIDWVLAHTGQSSGSTAELETFTFTPVIGSYVRIVGYGNSESDWSSILEVDIPNVNKSGYALEMVVVEEPILDDDPIVVIPVDVTPTVPAPVVIAEPEDEIVEVDTPAMGDVTVSNSSQLKDALSRATGGEVILLKNGNYGALTITKQYSDYVVLRAENQYGAVFTNILIDGSNKGYVQFDRIRSGGIKALAGAHHLKYTNSKFSSTVYFKVASNIIIHNNIIDVDGGYHAVLMNSVSKFELTQNYIARAQEDLMRLTGDSEGGIIKNNIFYDTLPQNIPSERNACEYNHSDAIQMFGFNNKNPRGITIKGNYFYDDPSNNAIRPTKCANGKENYRLNMQGIFLSDPHSSGYVDFIVEENIMQLGSSNSIYVNGATENVLVRNNTILPWMGGRGGSIRVVEKAKKTNKGLTMYGNIATAVSDETTSLSNGKSIGNNFVYERSDKNSSSHVTKLFQGAGEGARWQYFLPVEGSVVGFGSGYGALGRLNELKNGIDVPLQTH